MKYEPLPHQLEKSKECLKNDRRKRMTLGGEARSGKTFTSILVAEGLEGVKSVLVLTKKNAIMNHGAQLRVGVAVLVYVILIFLVTLLVRLNEVNLVDHLCGRLGEILEQASADSSYHAGTEHHSVP